MVSRRFGDDMMGMNGAGPAGLRRSGRSKSSNCLQGRVENMTSHSLRFGRRVRPPNPIFFSQTDEGGEGVPTYPPTGLGWRPPLPTYLPKMRHTHPTLPPKNPKPRQGSEIGGANSSKGLTRNNYTGKRARARGARESSHSRHTRRFWILRTDETRIEFETASRARVPGAAHYAGGGLLLHPDESSSTRHRRPDRTKSEVPHATKHERSLRRRVIGDSAPGTFILDPSNYSWPGGYRAAGGSLWGRRGGARVRSTPGGWLLARHLIRSAER